MSRDLAIFLCGLFVGWLFTSLVHRVRAAEGTWRERLERWRWRR